MMKRKRAERIGMGTNINEGFELSDEILETIVGGVLDEGARKAAYDACALFKQKGTDKSRVLQIFGKTEDPQLREDVLAYINEIWDTL